MTRLAKHRWSIAAVLIATALCGCFSGRTSLQRQRDMAIVSATEQCKSEYSTPELDPIRHKVELYRESTDAGVPFEIASNDDLATDAELPAIAKWATLREECIRRTMQGSKPSPDTPGMHGAFVRQRDFLYNQAGERISGLIVALYQKKLTYGEFAHKRYQINRTVWMLTAAAADVALVLPARVAKIFDLDSVQNPVSF